MAKTLDKDYYQWKLDFDKKGTSYCDNLKFMAKQLNDKKKAMA
jgi:hypothetical protein